MIISLLRQVICVSFIAIFINADIQINQTKVFFVNKTKRCQHSLQSISLHNICHHIYTEKIKINVKTIIQSIAMF